MGFTCINMYIPEVQKQSHCCSVTSKRFYEFITQTWQETEDSNVQKRKIWNGKFGGENEGGGGGGGRTQKYNNLIIIKTHNL